MITIKTLLVNCQRKFLILKFFRPVFKNSHRAFFFFINNKFYPYDIIKQSNMFKILYNNISNTYFIEFDTLSYCLGIEFIG